MARRKKEPPKYTVHFEYPRTEEEHEAFMDIMCRIAFGMNLEQTVEAVAKNQGGRYDYLYGRGDEQ